MCLDVREVHLPEDTGRMGEGEWGCLRMVRVLDDVFAVVKTLPV